MPLFCFIVSSQWLNMQDYILHLLMQQSLSVRDQYYYGNLVFFKSHDSLETSTIG